jgi:hypothetical protein
VQRVRDDPDARDAELTNAILISGRHNQLSDRRGSDEMPSSKFIAARKPSETSQRLALFVIAVSARLPRRRCGEDLCGHGPRLMGAGEAFDRDQEDKVKLLLTYEQRESLQAARKGNLDKVVADLRQRNPSAFHTSDSLHSRCFFDRPLRNEPCIGYLRSTGPEDASSEQCSSDGEAVR